VRRPLLGETRPVLVISTDEAIAAIPAVVTVLPLTTQHREWGTRVPVTGSETGLNNPSWAICERIRTVSTERIGTRLGAADQRTLTEIKRALPYLLNLQ